MKNSNFKRFLLLWMGQLISAIGGGLTSFGLGMYIFQKTGSAAGMVMVFAGVALVIVSVSMLFINEIRLLEVKKGEER